MSDSPYKSPQPTESEARKSREPLRRAASYQRLVMAALLANGVGNIAAFATAQQPLIIQIAGIGFSLIAGVFAMVAVFLLAKEVMNAGVGVLCALLMVVPCISLIVLLVVNQKATSFLQANGIHVGLLGADPNSI